MRTRVSITIALLLAAMSSPLLAAGDLFVASFRNDLYTKAFLTCDQ